ncbi:MAG: 16S rRNA (adenine(1518)-N(6)/adenine(1519)-N(6))-dimethyltransferase RsmA [Oscillospiraceae bacterium]|jgi:16S rRNA (adenine1518-N6/adenine1519-N6)-dimethyltransferase|nr:16S rRNA (adenine(1518)-N(6)/adenine(1519)-N(6))-dimethyltransferase RsmA [Oscillospiraceae bacterium]
MDKLLTDPRNIRARLAAHGFAFSKRLGQNFLADSRVPDIMASFFDPGQAVLEIGPGFGALTAALCEVCGAVVAVEKDKRLLPLLKENLADCQNLTVIEGDALRLDLPSLMPQGLRPAVCANLPYSVTTPILTALLESGTFDPIIVMVQREVALRLTACPGTPEYGAMTVFTAMSAQCSVLFDVPPESFIPRPAVTSSVVRLDSLTFDVGMQTLVPTALRLSRAAFAQRRKTLGNALSAGLALPRESVTERLKAAGFDPGARGETISPEGYLSLARFFTP